MKDREMFRLGFFCRSAIARRAAPFCFVSFRDANVLTWHHGDARTDPEFKREGLQ